MEYKTISKQEFDKLLKYNKNEAIKKLKNDDNEWLEEVVIRDLRNLEDPNNPRDQKYKIFWGNIPNDLFNKQDNGLLPEYTDNGKNKKYAALIVPDVDCHGEIKRNDFKHWYFLGNANFRGATFNLDACFFGAFFEGDALFERVSLRRNCKMDFERANFNGTANFEKAPSLLGNMIFERVIFNDNAYFGNGTEFKGELSFFEATFEKLCDLTAKKFGTFVNFTGTCFNGRIKFFEGDGKKLCEDEKKLSKPTKLIVYDDKGKEKLEDSRRNLHAVKQIFNKIANYEAEDHFYYWYKVYNRKCKPKNISRLFDWLLLDKLTGYFTRPRRVFGAMLVILLLFFGIFFSANVFPDKIGYLQVSNVDGQYVQLIEHTKGVSIDFFRDILYFDLITFTTIGYGDIQPTGWLKIIAGVEGFIGVLLISTFLVTLTKKVLW